MPAPTPTVHRARDGLLVFALATFAIGLTMLCAAAAPAAMADPALPVVVGTSEAADPSGATSPRPHAAARRGSAPLSMLDWGRSLVEAPNPQRRVSSSGDPRDELLALAALQRRWGLPSESYAAAGLGS